MHNKKYKETYRELSHGTDVESATIIRNNGFKISERSDSWCGPGIYFYDIKKKAWWAARRKCSEIKKETGKKVEPTVLFADIIDIETDKIFDLRAYKDLCDFEEKITPLLGEYSFELSGMNETEKIIQLRSLFISYYAEKNDKKLIIGNFRQRPQPMYEHAIEFSNSLDMIFGIETIYCVKDSNIIENIHYGRECKWEKWN